MASSSGYVPNSTGGYTYWNDGGTSFAGPYVAGLAALLWQQNPDATAAQIIGKITAGAHLGESQALADFKSSQVGGPGVDMAQFAGQRANYSIAGNADGSFDIANLVDGSTRHLVNVERVQFANTTVALDVGKGELGGEAYRLYQAAFGRTPDAGGLSFWLNALDHGATLLSVAKDFVTSTEFKSLYGANPGSTELVTAMYHNVLHREPDVNGLNYWLDAMNRGLSAQQLLTDFSESAENITQVASIIGRGFEYTPYA
jgi:hypothetical protein